MAILTAESWISYTTTTVTGGDLASIRAWCGAVSSALVQMLKPFHPEPITVTDAILDAPPSRDLILPVRPARSITSVYYRPDAYGVVANFTSTYLINNDDGDEYQLLIDDPVNGISRSGILRRIGRVWGWSNITRPGRLASTLEPERGSIKVTYTAGPAAMPPEVEAAAVLAVSFLYDMKKTGKVLVSESWNGWSGSYSGPATTAGVLNSPDIQSMLAPYLPGLRIA
jgi:hypothetical protein